MLDNLQSVTLNLREIDSALFFLINKNLQTGFLDIVMPFVTKHAELVFLGPVLWAAAKEKKAIWQILLISLFAVVLADGSGHILKDIIQRQRPCNTFSDINLLVGCGHSYSMPSNHALDSFAFATTFFVLRRNVTGYLSLAAAAVISISRVYVGVHYPSDILAGVLLGAGAAYAAILLYRWGSRIYEKKAYGEALVFFLFLISLFRVYFILTSPFDLSPDEAHYWEWSRRLDLSYYSKGPMIAYLIYLGTSVFGDTVFGVRALAVVLSAASSCLIYLMARDLYGEKAGLVSGLLVQIVPLFSVFGVLFTIDSPFIFFWVLSLYVLHKLLARQLHEGRKPTFDYYWVLLGVSIGLGLLTKYTMAFFLLSGLLFLLSSKNTRGLLKTPGPYIAVLISLAVFSPVILWNAANGWVTLKHTAGQTHVAEGLKISAKDFIEFTGSQFGVITPVLFVLIVAALWKIRKTEKGALLLWFSAPTVIFFLLKSLQGKVEANWALPGYATGFIAFSACYAEDILSAGRSRKALLVPAILLSMVVTFFAHFPSMLHLPQKMDPTSRLVGWKELGQETSVIYKEMARTGPVFIFASRYQVSSELAFYMDGNPVTYCINFHRRMNQYDLWPGFEGFKGQNAVYVRMSGNLPEEIGSAFERCEKQPIAIQTKQNKKVKFTIFKCYDFKGLKIKQPESY
jgi:4-amino-4-deoxy-L-arabinose transferase-like glycosyltransferase/membrane-associated phospholipid phosphatase